MLLNRMDGMAAISPSGFAGFSIHPVIFYPNFKEAYGMVNEIMNFIAQHDPEVGKAIEA